MFSKIKFEVFFIFILIVNNISAQNNSQSCYKVYRFVEKMNLYHVQPPAIDDKFSALVYTSFLKTVDPLGLVFLSEDELEFLKYKFQIDNQINDNNCDFFQIVLSTFKKRISQLDSASVFILSKKMNFTTNETLEYEKDSLFFCNSQKAQYTRLEKWIKYYYLHEAFNEIDSIEIVDLKEVSDKIDSYKENVEKSIRKNYDLAACEKELLSNYLNCIARAYDPHSSFFNEIEFEEFKNVLSKEISTFGFTIEENSSGDICIEDILPGAPAWQSNKIHRGDILLKIEWKNKSHDITKNSLKSTQQIIRKIDSDKISLTIKSQKGEINKVLLIEQKIENEESAVRSFVLNGEKKVGYISLPDFYTEWDKEKALGCANDVAKEIIKLKNENIEGLILDLRNNGGGSVYEAINLAGIFVNEGPLSIVKVKAIERPYVFKDMNRGSAYDGPLVVMINNSSASASEFVAAALQDYNRAIIVGSNSFGKGTMQVIYPVDSADLKKKNNSEGIDYMKVTIGTLYRINNETVQKKGVIADIIIPDVFGKLPFAESFENNAIIPNPINKKLIYTTQNPLPLDILREKSKSRISNDIAFHTIYSYQDSLLTRYNRKSLNISIQGYKNDLLRKEIIWDSIKITTSKKSDTYIPENTNIDQQWINMDANKIEVNNILKEDILKDIYIQETFKIITDLIMIKQ